jgi:hypothetical protein
MLNEVHRKMWSLTTKESTFLRLITESTYINANHILEQVSKFMKSNLLHINMSECCYMHFRPNHEFDATCARARPYADENNKSRAIFINGKKSQK